MLISFMRSIHFLRLCGYHQSINYRNTQIVVFRFLPIFEIITESKEVFLILCIFSVKLEICRTSNFIRKDLNGYKSDYK